MQKDFCTQIGTAYPYPLFFPDATYGEVRHLTNDDIRATQTDGILVNTFHVMKRFGGEIERSGGVRTHIGWDGPIISDSGGFQVMSIAKKNAGLTSVTDTGVTFTLDGISHHFTPEDSIRYQMKMRTDLMVVLDDFTPPDATHEEAAETVRRTTLWAKQCKETYLIECERLGIEEGKRPYLIGVVQGGYFEDLRKQSAQELSGIGFDGYGYGGWPLTAEGKFDTDTAKLIADSFPKGTLLYGLGIGKPDDIVICHSLGWNIFDCVLPTRDARHGRLYVYTADSIDSIDIRTPGFYEYYTPKKSIHLTEDIPISTACDCALCTTLTRAQLAHMWKEKDIRVLRLATIHNLRFYSLLIENLRRNRSSQTLEQTDR